jgi:hypothetical protein
VNIPWKENATLVRVVGLPDASGDSAAILFEGTLLTAVREMAPTGRRGLRLSLPDRRVPQHT